MSTYIVRENGLRVERMEEYTTGDNERQSPTGIFEAGQGMADFQRDVVARC